MSFKILVLATLMFLACEGFSINRPDTTNIETRQVEKGKVRIISDADVARSDVHESYHVPKIQHDDNDEMVVKSRANTQRARGEHHSHQVSSQENLMNTIYKDN